MLWIAICDDDVSACSEIEELLMYNCKEKMIQVNIDVFFSGTEIVRLMQQTERYDLIYLDIKMDRMDGIETARLIRKFDPNVLIVYVSSYDEHVKKLFAVEPFRFIDKPIDSNTFHAVFEKACEKIMVQKLYFQFKYNKEIYKVLLNDIVYFESDKRVILIHLKNDDNLTFYGKLNEIEKNLTSTKLCFLRIHQSFLVNVEYIRKITFSYIELTDNTILRISEDRKRNIRKQYCNYAGGEISE